jgi:hypothetical protein
MKVTALKYQRNGISGEPFYHCAYENEDGQFLATFESDENDTLINTTNCRVVCLDNLDEAWRGDRIANELQQELQIQAQVNGVTNIYDLSKKI